MLWRDFWLKGELRCSALALLSWLRFVGLLAVSKDERFALRYGISINQDLCSGQQFTSGEKNDTEEELLKCFLSCGFGFIRSGRGAIMFCAVWCQLNGTFFSSEWWNTLCSLYRTYFQIVVNANWIWWYCLSTIVRKWTTVKVRLWRARAVKVYPILLEELQLLLFLVGLYRDKEGINSQQ
jgi:hypothetical protein